MKEMMVASTRLVPGDSGYRVSEIRIAPSEAVTNVHGSFRLKVVETVHIAYADLTIVILDHDS